MNNSGSGAILTNELRRLGFEEMSPSEPTVPRVVCCTAAVEKLGKTHWAMTGPGPIAVISSDAGTREVAQKFARTKKIIYISVATARELLREGGSSKTAAAKEWSTIKNSLARIVDTPSIRTVVIDTATEIWELCRLSYFGKLAQVMPHQYAEPNDDYRKNVLKYPYERPDLNAIFIHTMKKEYKSGRDGKDAWTGKWERAGMGAAPYVADIVLNHYRRSVDPEENENRRVVFGVQVMDSRFEPEALIGMEMEGAQSTFPMLALGAFPATDLDYWL
jgi:hypothetical protein